MSAADPTHPERIFVQIASYRDRECQWTIQDLFAKATHPERIFVGVCWQYVPGEDQDCFEATTRPDQVRSVHFPLSECKGVGLARARAQSLWRGEEYCLQIDSHMRFVSGWDERMLVGLRRCSAPDPVLTVYPPGYTPPGDFDANAKPAVMKVDGFREGGLVAFGCDTIPDEARGDGPVPTACLAGGFLFGSSRIIEAVPYDPDLYFFGEEISLAARLWTHGFDLFSPDEILLYHYYIRSDGLRHWDDHKDWGEIGQPSIRRVQELLGCGEGGADVPELGRYGLGTARSLDAYQRFSGMDFAGRTIASYARTAPYVLCEETRRSLLTPGLFRTSETARLSILDDQSVVFSPERGELTRLNTAATFVWCLLEDEVDPGDIVARIATQSGVEREEAEESVAALFGHWEALGLLARREVQQSVRAYRLLDCTVKIRYAAPEIEARVHPTIAHLEVDAESVAEHVFAVEPDGGEFALRFGRGQPARCERLDQLAPRVKFALLSLEVEHSNALLALHAGAVVRNGTAILFPGSSGSGKTLLTARLARNGFEYGSDELVLLDRERCEARPLPVGMCVKSDGVSLLAPHYPEVDTLDVQWREDDRAVRYLPPPAPVRGGRADDASRYRVRVLVFPHYWEGKKARLAPLDRAEALKRLLAERMETPAPLDASGVEEVVRWLRNVECFELRMGSLEEAARLVDRMTSELERATS